MINSKYILAFILSSLIVLQNTPPNLEQEEKKLKSEKLKIEEGIKKTEQDIKKLTKELKVIKKRILESEQNLNKATKEAIKRAIAGEPTAAQVADEKNGADARKHPYSGQS